MLQMSGFEIADSVAAFTIASYYRLLDNIDVILILLNEGRINQANALYRICLDIKMDIIMASEEYIIAKEMDRFRHNKKHFESMMRNKYSKQSLVFSDDVIRSFSKVNKERILDLERRIAEQEITIEEMKSITQRMVDAGLPHDALVVYYRLSQNIHNSADFLAKSYLRIHDMMAITSVIAVNIDDYLVLTKMCIDDLVLCISILSDRYKEYGLKMDTSIIIASLTDLFFKMRHHNGSQNYLLCDLLVNHYIRYA